jgi:aminopeptidase N
MVVSFLIAASLSSLGQRPESRIISNRQNGFTRADTLRGKLTPLRSCYDVTFYHLDISIDIDRKFIEGTNLIRFKTLNAFTRMQIDLYANMTISRILYKQTELHFSREYDAVFIDFPDDRKTGEESEILIYYEGIPKSPDYNIPMDGGAMWAKDSLNNVWAQMVCQGSGASLWWPNKDHLSDEPDSMKVEITIPSSYTEISNGQLISVTAQPGNRTCYTWFISYPINNYNVTFNIGKYVHFKDFHITDDTLTIDYYVLPYHYNLAKALFQQVPAMLKVFEKNFGKYPFARDGFTLVESLYPMEHQSGVCIGKISSENFNETSRLLWHESAHEWWGNAVSCSDVADLWMHEAFATYAEIIVLEEFFGKDEAGNALEEHAAAVEGFEPVTGVYDVNHIHYNIGDMYNKGSLMLHTFRNILNNDKRWVDLLHAIQNHFRYRTVSSDSLVRFINELTQTDYTYFFDQYLHYTTIPTLQLKTQVQNTSIAIKYRWVANADQFRMPARVGRSSAKFQFIFPSAEWKTMLMKSLSIDDLVVDSDNFYINVEKD